MKHHGSISLAALLFFATSAGSRAGARLAKPDDLPYVVKLMKVDIDVAKDGTSTRIYEILLRINNDQGRESESVQDISFNDRAQKVRILSAYTILAKDGKSRIPVRKENIEFKEVGDSSRAFDVVKRATLSYSNVTVGSQIYLKYEIENREVPIKGFWSSSFSLTRGYYENVLIHIHSKLPLVLWKNDPGGLLSVESPETTSNTTSKNTYDVLVKSKAPIVNGTVQEEESFLRPSRVVQFAASSISDWKDFAKTILPVQEALLKMSLPPELERIRKLAAEKMTTREKLETVTAQIAQEFRYFGDWRRINGGFVPRTLQEISETRYGDCKDLSLIATAIYRALGFTAHLAWVLRDSLEPMAEMYAVPSETWFDHAISRVEADGNTYWIDATNPVSYIQAPRADIAGRPAFITDPLHPRLDMIPALTQESGQWSSVSTYRLQKDLTLKVDIDVKMQKASAIWLTEKIFYEPIETLNYEIGHWLSNYERVSNLSVTHLDRSSRVVKDLNFNVKFDLPGFPLRTTAGFGFPLFRETVLKHLLIDVKDHYSDINLGHPVTISNTSIFLGMKKVGRQSLDCDLKSQWIEASRKLSEVSGGVRVDELTIVKGSIVPFESIATEKFAKFVQDMRDCFLNADVILEAN
jgi:transglutaminase-like putative cysteine protease